MVARDDLFRLEALTAQVLEAVGTRDAAIADAPLLAELRELQERVTEAALLEPPAA